MDDPLTADSHAREGMPACPHCGRAMDTVLAGCRHDYALCSRCSGSVRLDPSPAYRHPYDYDADLRERQDN